MNEFVPRFRARLFIQGESARTWLKAHLPDGPLRMGLLQFGQLHMVGWTLSPDRVELEFGLSYPDGRYHTNSVAAAADILAALMKEVPQASLLAKDSLSVEAEIIPEDLTLQATQAFWDTLRDG